MMGAITIEMGPIHYGCGAYRYTEFPLHLRWK